MNLFNQNQKEHDKGIPIQYILKLKYICIKAEIPKSTLYWNRIILAGYLLKQRFLNLDHIETGIILAGYVLKQRFLDLDHIETESY